MREGDIYSWHYPPSDKLDHGAYGSYHCKSQIAVYDGKNLLDTFWGNSPTDGSYLNPEEVVLTLLGNKNELEVLTDVEDFYDPSDLVVMRHPNSTSAKTLIKPGASRCKKKMHSVLLNKKNDAEQKIRSAQHDLRRLAVAEYKLENEDISKLYF